MAQDTLLGFPAHTLPYRRGEFTTLSTVSGITELCLFFTIIFPFDEKHDIISTARCVAWKLRFSEGRAI